ncbi:OmpA family protein [Maridesulfovibrio zosterae]|uniref:OmpA family protein n=1 Tax=Maridesulfovibrio zosterae TaxID=82171 RepID=UPI0004158970|nr:OmpA family protein [Maridesulfovibrio zosterae]
MKKVMIALVIVCLFSTFVDAQENGFANNPDEIVNMLTNDNGRVFLKIEFEVNSSRISKKAIPVAKALGTALTSADAADMYVKLIGHTDSVGNRKYNRKLSLNRAKAVKDYLCAHYQIDPSRISLKGMGEESPIAPNNTSMGRALNRRVEVVNIRIDKEKSAPDVNNILFQ